MTMRLMAENGPDDVDEEATNVVLSDIRLRLLEGGLTDGDAVEYEEMPDVRKDLSNYSGLYQDSEGALRPFRLVWYPKEAKLCVYTRSIPVPTH